MQNMQSKIAGKVEDMFSLQPHAEMLCTARMLQNLLPKLACFAPCNGDDKVRRPNLSYRSNISVWGNSGPRVFSRSN